MRNFQKGESSSFHHGGCLSTRGKTSFKKSRENRPAAKECHLKEWRGKNCGMRKILKIVLKLIFNDFKTEYKSLLKIQSEAEEIRHPRRKVPTCEQAKQKRMVGILQPCAKNDQLALKKRKKVYCMLPPTMSRSSEVMAC